jgi:hypothetical protein
MKAYRLICRRITSGTLAGYLTSCRDHRYCINLYSLHSYFVEVWYDTRLSHIHAITAFTNSRRLDSYLESVSVSSLINRFRLWNKSEGSR